MKIPELLMLTIIISQILTSEKLCLKSQHKKCLKCSLSYLSKGKCIIPKIKIPNCRAYKDSVRCSTCEFGHYLKNGKCHKIEVKKCAASPSKDICYICEKGLKLDKKGKCNLNCKNENTEFCFDFAGVEISFSCKKGFSLDETKKCVNEPVENCEIVKDGVCDTCKYDHYMKNGKCIGKNFALKKVVELKKEKLENKPKLEILEDPSKHHLFKKLNHLKTVKKKDEKKHDHKKPFIKIKTQSNKLIIPKPNTPKIHTTSKPQSTKPHTKTHIIKHHVTVNTKPHTAKPHPHNTKPHTAKPHTHNAKLDTTKPHPHNAKLHTAKSHTHNAKPHSTKPLPNKHHSNPHTHSKPHVVKLHTHNKPHFDKQRTHSKPHVAKAHAAKPHIHSKPHTHVAKPHTHNKPHFDKGRTHNKPHVAKPHTHSKPHTHVAKPHTTHNKPHVAKPHTTHNKPKIAITKPIKTVNKEIKKTLKDIKNKGGKEDNHKKMDTHAHHKKMDEIKIEKDKHHLENFVSLMVFLSIESFIFLLFV